MIHFLAGFISGRNKKGANASPPFAHISRSPEPGSPV